MITESKIICTGNAPQLFVDGSILPACAYITYFEENNDYKEFANRGFRLFSVSLALADQPINATSGFNPHQGGVFDRKGQADFSFMDAAISRIIEVCPDAYIFPRVYVSMPQWWIEENPTEVVPVAHGKQREALYSQKFREDAAQMLQQVIAHFQSFPFSRNIIGYQISGGNTQEWFHLDLNGSFHKNALPYYNQYLVKNGLSPAEALPDLEAVNHSCAVLDPMQSAYIRFANESVAETIDYLCKTAKEAVAHRQVIGVFYGYTMEISNRPLWGSLSLASLLDSPYIDFFSSPNSYVSSRALGIDWPDMIPVDSIILRKKMCFMECDIRTHLTKVPSQVRPGCDPYHIYTNAVWAGPPTEALSVSAIRKCLGRQLTHKHGLWWFDMFGHWFATDKLMAEMERSLELYQHQDPTLSWDAPGEVAVFLDETATSYIGKQHPAYTAVKDMRIPLGATGAPYHVYLFSDFDRIDWKSTSYKVALFLIPKEDPLIEAAKKKLDSLGIASLGISGEKPTYSSGELRSFYSKNGVFLYSNSDDVVYAGNGYVCFHAATEGEKTLSFPVPLKCTDLVSGSQTVTNHLCFFAEQFETRLYRVEQS